jgi:hypothetical protein
MAAATLDRCELTYGDHTDFELDATYRCDRCGAQAYIKAVLRTPKNAGEKGELFWCSHHAHQYEAKLLPLCKEWHDETKRLEEDKKTGSEN